MRSSYCKFEHRDDWFCAVSNVCLGGVCSLANYSVAYEETQSNRVSDFHDFVCSLFPKAILFYFYFTIPIYIVPTLPKI